MLTKFDQRCIILIVFFVFFYIYIAIVITVSASFQTVAVPDIKGRDFHKAPDVAFRHIRFGVAKCLASNEGASYLAVSSIPSTHESVSQARLEFSLILLKVKY